MSNVGDGRKRRLAMCGLFVSIVCCTVFAFVLFVLGSICFSPFMGEEPKPGTMQIGMALYAVCAVVVLISARAHIHAVRFLLGRRDALSLPDMVSGVIPAISGASCVASLMFIALASIVPSIYALYLPSLRPGRCHPCICFRDVVACVAR